MTVAPANSTISIHQPTLYFSTYGSNDSSKLHPDTYCAAITHSWDYVARTSVHGRFLPVVTGRNQPKANLNLAMAKAPSISDKIRYHR